MSIRERKRTSQLNIRVTPEELEQIRTAADSAGVTMTRFVVKATIDKINDEGLGFKGTLRRMREAGEV